MKKINLSITTALLLATNLYSAENLGTISVSTATKSEQSIKDITSNVEVITSAELEEKHISTVAEALRGFGITISQSGGLGQLSSFYLNGQDSGSTLVLIDGIKYNNPTTTNGEAHLEHLAINDIQRIEIVNGAQSGIWGANASAGVINIITKNASKKLKIDTNIEYGSFNTKKVSANISQKIEKVSYKLGVNYLDTDGITAQAPNGKDIDNFEDDGYQNTTFNLKLGYDLTHNDLINFSFVNIDTTTQYDNDPSFTATDEQKANNSDYELEQKNKLYKIGYIHNFSLGNYLSTNYSKSEFQKNDPKGFTTKFNGYNDEIAIDGKINYIDNSFLLIGVNQQNSKDEINNRELKSNGIYITNNNKVNNLVLTQSIRYDNYDDFKNKTTGKIGVRYNFNKDIALMANYGTAYKTPSLYQLFDSTYGNKNLNPETTKSKDISLIYKDLKLTYFDNVVTDLIGYNPTTWVNEQVDGESKFKGYKVSYEKDVFTDLLFGFNYKKQSAKDKNNIELIRRVQESLNLSFDYYGIDNSHIGLYANYIGKRDDSKFNADFTTTKVQTGNYTLLNLVVNHDISKNINLYAKINNLTNKYYQEVYGYATSPRAYYAGIKYSF